MSEGLIAGRHRRIGLLGGSFNPAHRGHLHLSLSALRHLDLDEVWWMVSPQNPLKPVAGMAPFAERLDQARQVAAGHKRIHVTDIEDRLGGSYYTADTLRRLTRRFPASAVRLADGRRQSGAVAALGALDRDFRDRAHCRVRPPFLLAKGACRCRGSALCAQPRAGSGRAPAGRDKTAGLGVFSYPARSDFRDPDSIRAQDGADATRRRSKNPNWPRSPRCPHAPARGDPAWRNRGKSSTSC